MSSFFRKLRWWAQRRDKEAELREELRFHLEEEAEEKQERGLSENEAGRAARRLRAAATSRDTVTKPLTNCLAWGRHFYIAMSRLIASPGLSSRPG